MNDGQFRNASQNYPGAKKIWFKLTMTSGTAFTINRAAEFLAGTAAIVRNTTGVFDLFPEGAPGVGLLDWWVGCQLVTPASVTLGGTGETTIVNSLVSSSKLTLTFRRADTRAATDLVTGDVVHGFFTLMTVSL